jgi:hypothetical protein
MCLPDCFDGGMINRLINDRTNLNRQMCLPDCFDGGMINRLINEINAQ